MSIQSKICIIFVFAIDTKGKNGSYEIVGMCTKALSPFKMSCACFKWYSIIYSY